MRIGNRNTAAAWFSINEVIATADGATKEFVVPFDLIDPEPEVFVQSQNLVAEESEVQRDLEGKPIAALDGAGKPQPVIVTKKNWSIVKDKDGASRIVFEDFQRNGLSIGIGALGRKAGVLAFKLRPLTRKDQDVSTMPEVVRRYVHARLTRPEDDLSVLREKSIAEQRTWGGKVLKALVVDWFGFYDDAGDPLPFNEANLKAALEDETFDPADIASWAIRRAGQLSRLDAKALEAAAKNS